jgi:hypothetical protein
MQDFLFREHRKTVRGPGRMLLEFKRRVSADMEKEHQDTGKNP